MTLDPYTHVSLALEQRANARLNVAFHTPYIRVQCLGTGSGRPFLDVSTDAATVSISTSGGGPVTGADVALARTLHEMTGRYLAECERLHAERIATAEHTHGNAA